MSPSVAEAIQEVRTEWRLDDYLRFLRQHWIWLTCCGAVSWFLATSAVGRLPDIYQAQARLLIDRYTAEPVRFAETIPAQAALRDVEFLATEHQLIISRPVLETTIKELNLAGFPPFDQAKDPAAALAGMIRIAPIRATKLVDVVVTSENPSMAMRIANAVARIYVRLNLERRKEQTAGGADWLREELVRAETQMKTAQEALQRFKEEHQMVSLEERQNVVVQRLRQLSTTATEAQTGRVAAEAELREIERALAAGRRPEELSQVQTRGLIPALRTQLAEKEATLVEQRQIYGASHPTIQQLEKEIETLRGQIRQEAEKIVSTVRLEYATTRAREQELQEVQGEQERLILELNRLELEYTNLIREADLRTTLHQSLAKRLKELEVAESVQSNNVRLIAEAELPEAPVAPNRRRIVMTNVLLGLLLGGAVAFLREALVTTVRSRKDVETLLNLPFLGRVLRVKQGRVRRGQLPFILKQPESSVAESLRAIRTTLEFLLPEAACHRLVITSSLPQDGKSLVSANLAISLQEMGRRTVVIDADMRRPSLFRAFQVPLEPGLSTYLQGQATPEEIVRESAVAPGVTIITSGAVPARPADLLATPRMAQLLETVQASFAYIVIDTPPLLAVADATILSRVVDSAILVIRAGRTGRDAALAARQQLAQAPLKFLGVLLNDVRAESEYGYRYSYYYYSTGRKRRRSRPKPPAVPPQAIANPPPPLSDSPPSSIG